MFWICGGCRGFDFRYYFLVVTCVFAQLLGFILRMFRLMGFGVTGLFYYPCVAMSFINVILFLNIILIYYFMMYSVVWVWIVTSFCFELLFAADCFLFAVSVVVRFGRNCLCVVADFALFAVGVVWV